MEDVNYDHMNSLEEKNWWYKGKRNLFEKILEHITSKKGTLFESALDIGCGVGANLRVLDKYSEKSCGIDFSKKAVEYCSKRGFTNVMQGDVLDLRASVGDAKFDVIICSELLEHVNDAKAIEEIARSLKQAGILVFSVPAHKCLWNDNDDISHHKRRYGKKELQDLLRKDFRVEKLSYWNSTIFIPTFIFYKLQRIMKRIQGNKEKTNNLNLVPKFLNSILHFILKTESTLFQKVNLPVGISLVGVCIKK